MSDDSFSSSPDTSHNKGTLCFLALVEKMFRDQERAQSNADNFANLIIQMMDLNMENKVQSPSSV